MIPGPALRAGGFVLLDVPGANHAIHGPPGRVGVAIEMRFGKVAVGNAAIHAHVC